jgi:hypothetical protein
MASTGISEFTFGFAFLCEQVHANWKGLKAAPILPSLQKEADEGWDAHLPVRGTDFYYQFKLSDYLSAGHAKFMKDGTYSSPYYRISLHRLNSNRQHNQLVRHAKRNPNTYYVAPEFSGVATFSNAFLSRQLMTNSRLLPLNQCRPFTDGNQHFITFQSGKPQWKVHSETQDFESSRQGSDLEALYRQTSHQWMEIDETFAKEVFTKVSEQIQGVGFDQPVRTANAALMDIEQESRNRIGYLRRAAELLSLNFGVTLVIIGASDD